ncbi:hypothetical protein [Micromonospora chersina]|uniref:hypothetical protein n=1 Tax=Micromonospora chersina TaxID=47854 RepID=UPI0037194373
MSLAYESHELAVAVADLLAHPDDHRLPIRQPWWRQSLALGVPGIALCAVLDPRQEAVLGVILQLSRSLVDVVPDERVIRGEGLVGQDRERVNVAEHGVAGCAPQHLRRRIVGGDEAV